jgi:cytochrome c553
VGPYFLDKHTMKKILTICLLFAAFNSYADDVAEGRAKAEAACALCHGARGIATLPNAPNLAGQPAIYVSEQLRNYRSGKRQGDVMNMIAKNLSDSEIAQLAAWFSAIKVSVEPQ